MRTDAIRRRPASRAARSAAWQGDWAKLQAGAGLLNTWSISADPSANKAMPAGMGARAYAWKKPASPSRMEAEACAPPAASCRQVHALRTARSEERRVGKECKDR